MIISNNNTIKQRTLFRWLKKDNIKKFTVSIFFFFVYDLLGIIFIRSKVGNFHGKITTSSSF